MAFWEGRRVLVTGGASFIGSHVTEALVAGGARVRVADDLSSGRLENLAGVSDAVELLVGDLRDPDRAAQSVSGQELVIHLAADHGGRGYVDLHQSACATNMGLDQTVFTACLEAGVHRITYASSGCAYPNHIQTDPGQELYLTEDMVGPPYDPDGMYGLAKLAGELSLRALHQEHGIQTASCRYFTVYGPRGIENHAVIAMVARAFVGEDPFIVWGNGEQIRNWTYVTDIVSGTLLAAEKISDGTAINLGTTERIRVLDAVELVMGMTGHSAAIETRPHMPTGPMNRVADNLLAWKLLGWEPKVRFADGLRRTVDWYFATKDRDEVRSYLGAMLAGRPVALTREGAR